jgi:tetratricopeptide (TPR) repeat protein
VGEFRDIKEAEDCRDRFQQICSPVFIMKKSGNASLPYLVLIGHFPYTIEAWICKSEMNNPNIQNGDLYSWEWDGRELKKNLVSITLPFDTTGLEGSSPVNMNEHWRVLNLVDKIELDEQILLKSINDMTPDELLMVGIHSKLNARGIQTLEKYIAAYPEGIHTNRARLRLARRIMGIKDFARVNEILDNVERSSNDMEKAVAKLLRAYTKLYQNYQEAYEAFRLLASDTSMPESIRLESMRRAAGMAHAKYYYAKAYLCFEQLERVATNEDIASEALMQRAGLAFEMVGRDVGNWEEIRTMLEEVGKRESAPAKVKATANLMFAETFYKQDRWKECILHSEELRKNYPDINRESATALYWKAKSLHKMGNLNEALKTYEEIEMENVKDEDLFPGLNVKSLGLLNRIRIHVDSDNLSEATQILNDLKQRYPESNEYTTAKNLFD